MITIKEQNGIAQSDPEFRSETGHLDGSDHGGFLEEELGVGVGGRHSRRNSSKGRGREA